MASPLQPEPSRTMAGPLPHLAVTATKGTAQSPGSSEPSTPSAKDVHFQGAAPSSELFSILTAMAAGEHDSDSEDSEAHSSSVQSDATAAGPASPTSSSPSGEQAAGGPNNSFLPRDESDSQSNTHTVRSSTETAVDEWMDDALHQTSRQRDILSSRFTALSLSNLSPYGDPIARRDDKASKPRPTLPQFASQITADPEMADTSRPTSPSAASAAVTATPTKAGATAHLSSHSPSSPVRKETLRSGEGGPAYAEPSDEEKLAAIVEEFGPIADRFEGDEPERMLAESNGSLFKSVMMIGNLHLTTHRLLFHALLPPDSAFSPSGRKSSADQDAALMATARQSDVLYAGPITVHQTSPIKHTKRVWLELTAELVTSYPSGDEAGRVRPRQSILMSSIRNLEPFDPARPRDFFVVYDAMDGLRRTHFSVDTEQSAVQWRRAFQSALFRHARMQWRKSEAEKSASRSGTGAAGTGSEGGGPQTTVDYQNSWSTIRCCLPLDRVTIRGIGDYHNFSTLASLDIHLGKQKNRFPSASDCGGSFASDMTIPRAPPPNAPPPTTGPAHSAQPCLIQRTSSLKGALPFIKRSVSGSREASPSRAPPARSDSAMTPAQRFEQLNAQMPPLPPMHGRTPSGSHTPMTGAVPGIGETTLGLGGDDEHTMSFNLALYNEQAWFAEALQAAVQAAAARKLRPGARETRSVVDIAGYDCLATDDEQPEWASSSAPNSAPSSDHEGDDDDDEAERDNGDGSRPGPSAARHDRHRAREMSKAAKISMASKIFGLREEDGVYIKRCYVATGVVPARGHIIVTPKYVCFWRRAVVGSDIKYRFKTEDVKGARVAPGIRAAFHGMTLQIHGQHDVKFEFWKEASRQEVLRKIDQVLHVSNSASAPSGATARHARTPSGEPTSTPQDSLSPAAETASSSSITASGPAGNELDHVMNAPMFDAKAGTAHHAADILAPPRDALFVRQTFPDEMTNYLPFIANVPAIAKSVLTPRTFVCLTIGSRGDVQPYIALCLRLKADGHKVVIVTHDEFKGWIEGYGIEHRQAGGDPTALMKLSTEHKMFSPGFFKESLGSFRQWLDDLLLDSWNACKDADVLIESPSTMSGVHIAEALQIPYFRAFTMPWTRTSAYPHAFMVPAFEMGPSFNYSTYVLFDNIMWKATAGQINRWRKRHLGLRATDMSALSITKIPFLYNFSPAVVPKPLDWHDDIFITGYWNLANSDMEWTPPDSLQAFMDKAVADGKPLVYIGFGSIVVPDPQAMTKSIIKAVEKSGVRAIIAKGWSSRGGDSAAAAKEGSDKETQFPDSCYSVDKIPHGWLFPKIQAALHHGGAGTVGASLRAGLPTLIKPWFGDQFFWANRVTKLEVGLRVPSLRSDDIAAALTKATTHRIMIEKAARIGELIRSEDGVENAVQAIKYNVLRAGTDRKTLQHK